MIRSLYKITTEHDLVFFGIRWILVFGLSLLLWVIQNRIYVNFDSVSDIATVIAVGAGFNILQFILVWIPPLRIALPPIEIASDWVLVGLFCSLAPDSVFWVMGVTLVFSINGFMRFGSGWGTMHAVGVMIVSVMILLTSPLVGLDFVRDNPNLFAPFALLTVLVALVTGVWINRIDEENSHKAREIRQQMKQNNQRMESMRERSRALAEMVSALNGSLQYEKVLDVALDIGRFSLQEHAKQRLVSMVLMVENDYELRITTSRGLSHIDEQRAFRGQAGIIARAMDTGEPIIDTDADQDPELGRLVAFKNTRSVLTIPLRAGFDSYGVLIFGSDAPNAFNEDHIDTLKAIGIQTAIALQNASLYTSLMEEKERIIAIEESARKALVRDLHDVPTQTISAVTMRLGIIPTLMRKAPEQVIQEAEEIREMAQRATEEIRHVMFTLRPLALETQGLTAALEQLADKMFKTYKQRVNLQIANGAAYLIDAKHEGTLFYLIEEAVNNSRKYAGAKVIQVSMRQENSYLVVRISDNGKGFDMGSVTNNYESRGSFGMVNMRERAELIGGRFDLRSTPGVGTTVMVTVPISDQRLATAARSAAPARASLDSAPPRKRLDVPRKRSGPISPST